MALEIRRETASTAGLVADRRLYLSADESRVVEEGSSEAAFLLATPGTEIPAAVAARLGLELAGGRIIQRGSSAGEAEPVKPEPVKPEPVKPEPDPNPKPEPEPTSVQGKGSPSKRPK